MSIFCNIYLVVKINNWYCRKFKEKFQLTTPYWSMISSLLHLVGLRPRVYYTLTNFRGGGAKASLPPPLNTPMHNYDNFTLPVIIIIEVKCQFLQHISKIEENQEKQELERRSTLENRNWSSRSTGTGYHYTMH